MEDWSRRVVGNRCASAGQFINILWVLTPINDRLIMKY